jgi:hypothetical protein
MVSKATPDSTPLQKGQNLYDIYAQRSYSCTIDVPMGNMCIQPMQYFELLGTTMFDGVYIITDVENEINSTSNKVKTKFKGTRIKNYELPIISDSVSNIMSSLGIDSDMSSNGMSTTFSASDYGITTASNTLSIRNTNKSTNTITADGKKWMKRVISNNKKITDLEKQSDYSDLLIGFIEKYGQQFNVDANVLASQMYKESTYKNSVYSKTANGGIIAMGITQFTLDTINTVIMRNPLFTQAEKDKISKGITLEPSNKQTDNGYIMKGDIPRNQKVALQQNVKDCTEIMVKAQAYYMDKITKSMENSNNVSLASISLYGYNRGPAYVDNSGMNTYEKVVLKYVQKNLEYKFPESRKPVTEGTDYVYNIIKNLKTYFKGNYSNLDLNEVGNFA